MGKSVYLGAIISSIVVIVLIFVAVSFAESSKALQFNLESAEFVLEGQLQASYANFDVNNAEIYCEVVSLGITNLSKRSKILETQLAAYKENSFNTGEFYSVKRNYLLTNMILYKNFLDAKTNCDLNILPVLFFYAENRSCEPDCGVIGSQLFELRECKSFRAFNFPYNWDLYPFTKILEVKYGVVKPATLIIDGVKYESLFNMSDLSKKLGCSN